MTIDEAIAQEKELSEHCKRMFDDMNEVDKLSNKLLKNEIEYHEQLAEWLEDYKHIKQWKSDVMDDFCRYDVISFEDLIVYGRNKAIDDFVKFANTMPTVEEEDGTIRPMWLEEIAEKLKAGGDNE